MIKYAVIRYSVGVQKFYRTIKSFFLEVLIHFIGVDLHTNKFTCCYRDDLKKKKKTITFELTGQGLADFYQKMIDKTYILIERKTL